jgi:hypothetical protein
MKEIPYASLIGSNMYEQVCMCLSITFSTGMLKSYLNNLIMKH